MAKFKNEDRNIPEDETEEERRERWRKKIMGKMYNENGVAFAPWAVKQVNVEVSLYKQIYFLRFVNMFYNIHSN